MITFEPGQILKWKCLDGTQTLFVKEVTERHIVCFNFSMGETDIIEKRLIEPQYSLGHVKVVDVQTIAEAESALREMIVNYERLHCHYEILRRKIEHGCTNQSCDECDYSFPDAEDGPWSPGWFDRANETPADYMQGLRVLIQVDGR